MDNAAFHRSPTTKELIESVGCKLIFPPPYSPDLNPIEKFWDNMKRWIRERIAEFNGLYVTIQYFEKVQRNYKNKGCDKERKSIT